MNRKEIKSKIEKASKKGFNIVDYMNTNNIDVIGHPFLASARVWGTIFSSFAKQEQIEELSAYLNMYYK